MAFRNDDFDWGSVMRALHWLIALGVLGLLAVLAIPVVAILRLTGSELQFEGQATTLVVLLRELGWRDTLKATGIMLAAVVATGAAINLIWP